MGVVSKKNPFLTRLRSRDPRKRLWSPSSFLRVNTVIAIASLAMMPAAARQGALLIHLLFVVVFVTLLFSPSCTIFIIFPSRQEELLLLNPPSSLFPALFFLFLKKSSFGFRTEIVVFVVFVSSSLRAQRGDIRRSCSFPSSIQKISLSSNHPIAKAKFRRAMN